MWSSVSFESMYQWRLLVSADVVLADVASADVV